MFCQTVIILNVSDSGKDIEIPKISTKKPKAFKSYRGELTTLPHAEVIVKPSGKVIVKNTSLRDKETDEDNTKDESSKRLKGKSNKKMDNFTTTSLSNEDVEEEKSKKAKKAKKPKRKTDEITEAVSNAVSDKPNKGKKKIWTIESGKIEDEAISGVLTLGDQVKKSKKKRKSPTDLELDQRQKMFKTAKLGKSNGKLKTNKTHTVNKIKDQGNKG